MLSIGKAQGSYYVSLAKDDYYTHGGEPVGVWHGKGAERLGFDGEVDKREFLKLCDGVGKGGKNLVKNALSEDRVSGWDLTFSAPKSVSALWSQADLKTRLEIQKIQFEAVIKALNYLEEKAGFTRVGKGGVLRAESKLAFATFEHGTSRSQDPQLHTHAIVLNVGIRKDGRTGALDSSYFFREKMTAGALYRAELASLLRERLGVGIEKKKNVFEVKGVSKKLTDEFSTRRKEILEAMKKEGAVGAKRAAHFTMTTRQRKAHVAREILFEKWQEVGKTYNFDYKKVIGRDRENLINKLGGEDFKRQIKDEVKSQVLKSTLKEITDQRSYFSEKDLLRQVAQNGVGKLSIDEVREMVSDYLDKKAVYLGRGFYEEAFYTTRAMDALEKKMLTDVEKAKIGWHKAPPAFEETGYIKEKLNDEQKLALCTG